MTIVTVRQVPSPDVFNTELSPERYWRGPRFKAAAGGARVGDGGGSTIPKVILSPSNSLYTKMSNDKSH